MTVNWNQLRTWNGDQQKAFEELCCQLAFTEPVPRDSRFFRKGTPDAGVECFWRMPSGDEWGWQAKYFRQQLTGSQWTQLKKSFTTAVSGHPKLTKFIVCIPNNLADDRKNETAAKKWNELVKQWQSQARNAGREIAIELWDETQIGLRLANPEHQGTHWFWFDSEQRFTLKWFQDRLAEAKENAGDRYTPEAHVELPISELFSGLGRCPAFYDRLEVLIASLHSKHRKLDRSIRKPLEDASFQQIDQMTAQLSKSLQDLLPSKAHSAASVFLNPLPLTQVASEVIELARFVGIAADRLFLECHQEAEKVLSAEKKSYSYNSVVEKLRSAGYRLSDFRSSLYEIDHFLESSASRLANLPALLLKGHAGIGKTHLLCDIALRETRDGRPRILLHGSHFQDCEPWKQIIDLLGLNCTVDQFLYGLQATAQAHKCRILIFIDAINEGAGNSLWTKHLPGMLTRLRRYPWLGICLSVRTSYVDAVVPSTLTEEVLIQEVHNGFAEHEQEAVRTFFAEYGIAPTYPLLAPEFSQPLFLKLFCSAIRNSGLRHVPLGIRGITALLEFFLDSVNTKLARPEHLDYDKNDCLVQNAVRKIAEEMAKQGSEYLPRRVAESLVNSFRPECRHSRSLFVHLIHEGVLNVDRWHSHEGGLEVVQVSYQRFADHLVAKYLLESHLNEGDLIGSFDTAMPLGLHLKDERSAQRNSGLVEALSIQVPERVGQELVDVLPHLASTNVARDAFVESLVWRAKTAFGSHTKDYINKHVLRHRHARGNFWEAVLLLAPIPDHPYNADLIHEHLLPYSLPERDAWWTRFLHERCDESGPVSRLVDWAWSEEDKSGYDEEVIRLAATTIAWFLTSSFRVLRDQATKALVRLLENRSQSLQRLLADFKEVNDPYVAERLYAVAYGCAMRCRDPVAVSQLAIVVYEQVFQSKKPPVNIRIRDYARGLIELAFSLDSSLPIDLSLVRPPYGSRWPIKRPPSETQLRSKMAAKESGEANIAVGHLISSVTSTMEDFCKNVISGVSDWTNVRLNQTPPPTRKEGVQRFRRLLTKRQQEMFDALCNGKTKGRTLKDWKRSMDSWSSEKLKSALDMAEAAFRSEALAFRSTLRSGTIKAKIFDEIVLPYFENPHFDERRFDFEVAQRMLLQRVVELGWTAELFGEYDLSVSRGTFTRSSESRVDRIGLKYQWISYCELMARIADNFEMKGKFTVSGEDKAYEGPWQVRHGRDIDPSMLLVGCSRDNLSASTPSWWFQCEYKPWCNQNDHRKWLRTQNDLPDSKLLFDVKHPDDCSSWLALDGNYTWEEPTPLGMEWDECVRRKLWYNVTAVLVHSKDSSKFSRWAEKSDVCDLRSNQSEYKVFLGEMFWSPAYRDHDNEYHGREGWTKRGIDEMPCNILAVSEEFLRESGTGDLSHNQSIFMTLPCKQIVEGMNLSWQGRDSEFANKENTVVAYDPSVRQKGPGCLLVRRREFTEFLKREGLVLFWTVFGEKQRVGGGWGGEDYLGQMDISGVYQLDGETIRGRMRGKFITPKR